MSSNKPKNPYKVFHSPWEKLRAALHVVLVRPEHGGNVGSTARAIANMGIKGGLHIVGGPEILTHEARTFACHAQEVLDGAKFYSSLGEVLKADLYKEQRVLAIATTASVGSAERPHPLRIEKAVPYAMQRLKQGDTDQIFFVFGCESDGLTNEDVKLCNWIVTVPSHDDYRSLNLAQAVLLFAYEANQSLLEPWENFEAGKAGQKEKLIGHLLELAESVGFILPGDPYKMRPRLEGILDKLPRYIEDGRTLHGWIDQTIRSVRKGAPDLRGRYKKFEEASL